jgi:hypothetical protein
VAHALAISDDQLGAMLRDSSEHHNMNVAWVRQTPEAAVEIGLKDKQAYRRGGVIVVFRWSNGCWREDSASRRPWRPYTGPIGPEINPIVYPPPPRENP